MGARSLRSFRNTSCAIFKPKNPGLERTGVQKCEDRHVSVPLAVIKQCLPASFAYRVKDANMKIWEPSSTGTEYSRAPDLDPASMPWHPGRQWRFRIQAVLWWSVPLFTTSPFHPLHFWLSYSLCPMKLSRWGDATFFWPPRGPFFYSILTCFYSCDPVPILASSAVKQVPKNEQCMILLCCMAVQRIRVFK